MFLRNVHFTHLLEGFESQGHDSIVVHAFYASGVRRHVAEDDIYRAAVQQIDQTLFGVGARKIAGDQSGAIYRENVQSIERNDESSRLPWNWGIPNWQSNIF